MQLLRSSLLVISGFVLRLGAGMLVFVLMARRLGPEAFGTFSYWLAVATLATIPVNYGLGSALLRSFGIAPGSSTRSLGEALTTKLFISALVVLCSVAAMFFLSSVSATVFGLLLAAQLVDSFAEVYNLMFRVHGDFSKETVTASLTSLLHIILMLAALFVWNNLVLVSAAFFVSRTVGCLITYWRGRRCTGPIALESISAVPKVLKGCLPYAVEIFLITAYQQLDSILIQAILGPAAVGLYQAGMKLVQGVYRLAPVFAQVLLPSLSKAHSENELTTRSALRSTYTFLAVGAAGAILMAAFSSFITSRLFGPQYQALAGLLPLFGLLLFFRFSETGLGLILVAQGLQARKVWLVGAQLLAILVAGTWALKNFGLAGWQIANIVSLAILLILYLLLMIARAKKPSDSSGEWA